MNVIPTIPRFRLRKQDIVKLLGRRYNLRAALEIATPQTGLTIANWDLAWFKRVDRLVYAASSIDSTASTYQTISPFWCEIASAIALAKGRIPPYDLVFVDLPSNAGGDLTDLRAAWRLLRDDGFLVLHVSETHPRDLAVGRAMQLVLDLSTVTATPELYTIDIGGMCSVIRKRGTAGEETRPDGDSLLWTIVREDDQQRSAYLAERSTSVLNMIADEEFIEREQFGPSMIRHLSAAREFRMEEIDVSDFPPIAKPWLSSRPWIDRDDADIDGYISGLARLPSYDLAEKLRQWRDFGFVSFERAASPLLIDALLSDVEHFQANYGEYKIPIEIKGRQLESDQLQSFAGDETGIKLNHLYSFSRAAAFLSLTYEVADFLRHVFQAPPAVLQSLTFWRGSEQATHIDYPYVRYQKNLAFLAASWVALEDISPDAGPLGYYPGGHKVAASGFFDWGGSIVQGEETSRNPIEFADFLRARMNRSGISRANFCPKKGDIFIWHGNLPHEGTPVNDSSLTRKSYVTHFTSLPCLPDWQLAVRDLHPDNTVSLNGGFSFVSPLFLDRRRLPSWKALR